MKKKPLISPDGMADATLKRRTHIIDAADRLFRQHGFTRTTTSMIAAQAAVSKRDLYALFQNKNEVYYSVVEKNQRLFLDLPRPEAEDLPMLASLIKIFRLDMDDAAGRRRLEFIRVFMKAAVEAPEASGRLYASGRFHPREALMAWLLTQARRGKLPLEDEEDVKVYSGMLMNVVFGALLPVRHDGEEMGDRTTHVIKALTIFLQGVGCDIS
ncbi:TetR/AcrR family transcriptional regulator [Lonsdalea quercina]|uniref:TetR/AcrR family transcriptional regulator n=1 Tax=Lonsdalea quercina TaxID=71657 RepID=UPI003976FC38